MAYNFLAERLGNYDLRLLHDNLAGYELIEMFPVHTGDNGLELGISIPFKSMDDPRFATELENLMTYLVTEQGFEVFDLFTGSSIDSEEVSGLSERISR